MLSNIDKVRLTIGLRGQAEDLMTDDDILYFLEKNRENVFKASLDCAISVKFQLAQILHEKTSADLEIWGHTWFDNYAKALESFINNPNSAFGINQIRIYAGGINVEDIRNNFTVSTYPVVVDNGIPKDGIAVNSNNTQSDIFDPKAQSYI